VTHGVLVEVQICHTNSPKEQNFKNVVKPRNEASDEASFGFILAKHNTTTMAKLERGIAQQPKLQYYYFLIISTSK